VAATVEATATPIAPPICWEVFEQPGGDPGIMLCDNWPGPPIDTGMNAKAAPPARNNGPARFAQKCPWRGYLGGPQDPGADEGHPGPAHDELGREAGDEHLGRPGQARAR